MYSSTTTHAYYEPLNSAQLFPSSDASDPFTTTFDHSFFSSPSAERQHSIPFPSTFPSTFPSDLPHLPVDVDGTLFTSEIEEVVEAELPAPPLSPSSAFESESSSASSSSSSSARSSPPPDSQYTADDSPFQLSKPDSADYPEPPALTSTLLASLSFDPQQLLAQLTTDLSTPATAEPKKRNRIPGLTAQQRAALKRQKHREIDTQRRHREQAAISKLHTLVHNPVGVKEKKGGGRKRARGDWSDDTSRGDDATKQDDDDEEEDEENDEDDEEATKINKDKVTILEHSARRLEQMQSIIHQLTAACTTQQQHNRLLLTELQTNNQQLQQSPSSHPLGLFHPPVAQQLDANLGSQSLYASLFLAASAPMFIIRCDTGYITDVNSRLLQESGWMRHHLVGRLMTAPYDLLMCSPLVDLERVMRNASNRVLVEGQDGQLVPATKQEQYARSRNLAKQLYTGQVNQIDAVWRAQMRNGKVYEVMCKSWITGFRDVVDVDGRQVKRPNTVVFVCDTANAVCVDGS